MSNFLGKIASLKTEFNSLLPTGKSAAEDLAQRDKLFMVLTLVAISPDLAPIRDQILAGFEGNSITEILPILYITPLPDQPSESVPIPQCPSPARESPSPTNDAIVPLTGIHIVPDNVHEAPVDVLPAPDSSPAVVLPPDNQFPIAIRKGSSACETGFSKGLGFGKKNS
ncbi:hypothetical protein NE237_016001 [Protea cynaroides]|uniref:Uncharacterized protein n=1 Tax=Protea cynaroides TaxID=273540 RepID=A0A9Q0QRL3_9MAGN|nr:hypothetical protein NE237_016001 [Protea cynaroides]